MSELRRDLDRVEAMVLTDNKRLRDVERRLEVLEVLERAVLELSAAVGRSGEKMPPEDQIIYGKEGDAPSESHWDWLRL